MANITYTLPSLQGDITVPPETKIDYNGLEICGRGYLNWGDEFNGNYINLDDKITTVDAKIGTNVPANAVFTDTVYTKPSTEAISYITGLQTTLDTKLETHQDISMKLEASDITNKVDKVTGKDLSDNNLTNALVTTIGSALQSHQDISSKADIASVPTNVSQLTNDAGYLTVDANTQLSDAQIGAMGYIKTDNDTVYGDTEVRGLISGLDSTYATDTDIASKITAINTAWAAADESVRALAEGYADQGTVAEFSAALDAAK